MVCGLLWGHGHRCVRALNGPDSAKNALYFQPKLNDMVSDATRLCAWVLGVAWVWMFPFTSWAQGGQPWLLDAVTCHEVGAVMSFETSVRGQGEELRVTLPNLPDDIDVASAQIELPRGLELISVSKLEVLPDLEHALGSARRDVEGRTLALELEEALLQALDQERVFLEYNRSIGGGGEVLLVDDVEEMRHYLAQKHRELSLERVDLVSNIRALHLELDVARQDLEDLEVRAASPSQALQLVLSGTGRGDLRVHVATRRAGWVSSYDVSWDEDKDALSVERFARVVQTTGLDWEDVSLVLRTGEPLGAAMPQARRPQLKRQSAMSYDGYSANVAWVNSGLSDDRAREDVLNMQAPQSSNWQHDVKGRVGVSGSGDPARVLLDSHVLPATPSWLANVSLGEEALRSCHTKSWMDAGFLSGEGRVFQDGAMLGVMPLNMPSWGDSLNVMLGADETVRIARALLRDESGTKRLSGKTVVKQVRQLQVFNLEPGVASVSVVEALPWSSGWDVNVEPTAGGVYDEDTGEVRWDGVRVEKDVPWTAEVVLKVVLPKGQTLVGF